MTQSKTNTSPNPVDLHVGARIRMRRKLLGLSQASLAQTADVTFQQLQKYERGTNRVSASKLYEIAITLQVPIGWFFEGLPQLVGSVADDANEIQTRRVIQTLFDTVEGFQLAEAFPKVRSASHRRKIVGLVKAMADDEGHP